MGQRKCFPDSTIPIPIINSNSSILKLRLYARAAMGVNIMNLK
jgi:hypothetical protein